MAQPVHDVLGDVPIEIHKDHVIIRPPNRLKERAEIAEGAGPLETEMVRLAESALATLSGEFAEWMRADVEALDAAYAASLGASLDPLYRAAHDLRGQAATLGYPLAGEVADGLCRLIERMGDSTPRPLVDVHVDAIRAIVREDVRDRRHPLALALANRLAELREEVSPQDLPEPPKPGA